MASLIAEGKTKSLYQGAAEHTLQMVYRDDTTAFDGKKKAQLAGKGEINNKFNAWIMQKLEEKGIKSHFLKLTGANTSEVMKLDMIPLECVVRNITAGSICRRLGIEEGQRLAKPLFEIFLKDDDRGDPLVTLEHIEAFGWSNQAEVEQMKALTLAVNEILVGLFDQGGMTLVDYKLEFGRSQDGEIILGDEFTPDSCRVWDSETGKKLDKDRFRQGLGEVTESYQEIALRLGAIITLSSSNN